MPLFTVRTGFYILHSYFALMNQTLTLFPPTEATPVQWAYPPTGLSQRNTPWPPPHPAQKGLVVPRCAQPVPCPDQLVPGSARLVPNLAPPVQDWPTAVTRTTLWAVLVRIYRNPRPRPRVTKWAKRKQVRWDWVWERRPVSGCLKRQGNIFRRSPRISNNGGGQNVNICINIINREEFRRTFSRFRKIVSTLNLWMSAFVLHLKPSKENMQQWVTAHEHVNSALVSATQEFDHIGTRKMQKNI